MNQIVNIYNVDPNTFQLQDYSSNDESLIFNYVENTTFNPNEDYIEYYVLDLNQNILYNNPSGYPDYKIEDNNLILDPQKNLESLGFTEGQYYSIYNFLTPKLSSSPTKTFYIQDISADRTELRLNTTTIPNSDIIELTSQFEAEIKTSVGSYLDFYLNFGNNNLIIANNISLDLTNPNDPTVLIKLYQPLPTLFDIQSQCWIVEQVAESVAYKIEIISVFESIDQLKYLKGPNFNLEVQDQINNSTSYQNKNSLNLNSSVLGSGSLLYQINNILSKKGIKPNVDYSDYSNFIHFSSALTRLENFYYKLSLIEEYTVSSSYSNSTPTNIFVSSSKNLWDSKINEIITNFDEYEYYLYYSSGSYSWPKTNSSFPYINYSTGSIEGISWFTTQSYSASVYDLNNLNSLTNTIPSYLREDPQNNQYLLFTNMIGQHFDNVWIYIKDITNKFDADNRLNYGISKDLVAQAIRDLGIKIYQNNFSTSDLYSALLGVTPSGSNNNLPYTTGSLPTPQGYEYINNYITSSASNSLYPLDDINKETYKKIYHNLPYLLKKKGTTEGIKTLINIYGIPDTIIRVNEFGGKSNDNTNVYDNFVNQFNYEFYTTGSGYVSVNMPVDTGSGAGLYGAAVYGIDYYGGNSFNGSGTGSFTIEFRFKTTGIPTVSSSLNQLLAYSPQNNFALVLEYTGSGYTSGSYNGSIPDPYNEYGTLKFIDLSNNNISSSLYLPFFNGDWWSVMYNLGTLGNWILEDGNWSDAGIWYDTETWND